MLKLMVKKLMAIVAFGMVLAFSGTTVMAGKVIKKTKITHKDGSKTTVTTTRDNHIVRGKMRFSSGRGHSHKEIVKEVRERLGGKAKRVK